jgi:hypothetical protein
MSDVDFDVLPTLEDDDAPEPEQPVQRIRNQWNTRMVVSGDKTPSGTRYDVERGHEILPETQADYEYLLSLQPKAYQSCCNGTNPEKARQLTHYFTEV